MSVMSNFVQLVQHLKKKNVLSGFGLSLGLQCKQCFHEPYTDELVDS